MEDLRITVGKNLAALRKAKKLTQIELAEKMNYSDKAVSKWEQGATMPDLETLKQLCDFYGVSLDYLVHEENISNPQYDTSKETRVYVNRLIITILLGVIAFMIATLIYVYPFLFKGAKSGYWLAFVWAIPVSAVIMLITNKAFFKGQKVVLLIGLSIFIWSILAGTYLHFLLFAPDKSNFWVLFLVGIPLQAIAALWFVLRKK